MEKDHATEENDRPAWIERLLERQAELDRGRIRKVLAMGDCWENELYRGKHVFLGARYIGVLSDSIGPDGISTGRFKKTMAPNPITEIADSLGFVLFDEGGNRVPRT
jgi:hypothetical protein